MSLRTGDYRLALQRARVLRVGVELAMSEFRPSMSKAETEALVRGWIDHCLWRQEAHAAETDGIAFLDTPEIEKMGRAEALELDALFRVGARQHLPAEKARIARALTGHGMDAFQPIIDAAARDMKVDIDRDTPDGRLRARTVLRGFDDLLEKLNVVVASIPEKMAAAAPQARLPDFAFLAHWDAFEKHKLAVREWKGDTASNARSSANVFRGFFGEVTARDVIDSGIAPNFRASFLKLPRGYDKNAKMGWKGKPLSAIIASVKNRADIVLVSTDTANKHLANLSEYWRYLAGQKLVHAGVANPFADLFSKKKKGKAARDDHAMWPVDLDKKFFSSSIYFGCRSIHRRFWPGQEIHRDALFWVPLLGRTSGAREDELCSRLVKDIDFVDTDQGRIAFLKIRDSKTDSSARDVPFQQEILDLGFLEHRYYGRSPDEPLFPELIPQGAGNRRSAAFTGRFAEARKKIEILREGVDFKSYRDTVQTTLSNARGVNPGWIDELIGHDSVIRRSEGARYTKLIYMPSLQETINHIRLPVDLSHLWYDGLRGVRAPGAATEIERFVALANREMAKKAARRRQRPS